MKQILFSFICLFAFATAAQAQELSELKFARISWDTNTIYEFGKIPQNEPVTAVFKFTNIGNMDLIIDTIRLSCRNCMWIESYTRLTKPDEKGFIKVIYDAKRIGSFAKVITITTNAEDYPTVLYIGGEVTNTKE